MRRVPLPCCWRWSCSSFPPRTLAPIFSDHMVLQRGAPVKVWGWANAGEKVRVTVQGKSSQVAADAQGRWQTWVGPLEAGGPMEMSIQGSNLITIWDVVVGEVWVASGQSNMAMALRATDNADREAATADHPKIRSAPPFQKAMRPSGSATTTPSPTARSTAARRPSSMASAAVPCFPGPARWARSL